MHPEIDKIDARFITHERSRQTKNELKGAKISAKSMGKGLHK